MTIDRERVRLIVDSKHLMSTRALPVLREMAAQAFGDVLEVAYGLGISHDYLHANEAVNTIITVDILPDVFHLKECFCPALVGDFNDLHTAGMSFDTIMFDAEGDPTPLLATLNPGGRLIQFVDGFEPSFKVTDVLQPDKE